MPIQDEQAEPTTAAQPMVVVTHIDDAIAVTVATNGTTEPVGAWTTDETVFVSRLDTESGDLVRTTDVAGGVTPIGHPIERPALSVGDDDVVHVAFTSFVGSNGAVFYVDLVGEVATEPVQISGEPRRETNLVHMTQGDASPVLAWLEDSTLSVAIENADRPVEIENVDELTCDCCNPIPMRLDDRLLVAYRNQEPTDDGIVRDVFVTTTDDGGLEFDEPVLVADEPWFVDGCPFSGPAVAEIGDDIVVAWMDARQSMHVDQQSTTMWVDRSSDRGATFGVDLAITDGGIHRWPSLAVDDDTIHLIWETQAPVAGISHSASTDGGETFSAPIMLVEATEAGGPPRTPTAIVHDGRLLVSWIDRLGGHVAAYPLNELSPA